MLTLLINRYSPTKTETASEGGLDPTAEEIGIIDQFYHKTPTLSTSRDQASRYEGALTF